MMQQFSGVILVLNWFRNGFTLVQNGLRLVSDWSHADL